MPTEDALELFGGLDCIKVRMMMAIKEKLEERTKTKGASDSHLAEFVKAVRKQTIPTTTFWSFAAPDVLAAAQERGVDPGILWQIYEGNANGKVTYELFEDLQWSLDLSIDDVLGDPNISDDETRKYWEKQQQEEAPMLIAAKLPDEDNIEKTTSGIDLRMYLTLRAIEDLAWDPK